MNNIKRIVVTGLVIAASSVGSFYGGYLKCAADTGKTIMDLQAKFDAAQEMISNLKNGAEEGAVELANAIAKLAAQDEIIKDYEAKERTDATIEEIRDINVQCFKELKVGIEYDDEVPISIMSTKWELNPETFGNFTEVHEKLVVKYYFGAVANKINVENVDNEIHISYDHMAFIDPYIIISRDADTNVGAKLLTNYEDSKTVELVNDVGYNLLSNAEDMYLVKLTEKYANSDIPVYINGKKIKDWTESDKIFVAANPVNDATYSVEK